MIRSIFLVFAWLVATVALGCLVAGLNAWWNMFDWRPVADWESLAMISGIMAVVIVIWFLSRVSRDLLSRIVSLILCAAVLVLGIGHFHFNPEPVASPSLFPDVLGRTHSSPEWYRAGRIVLLCLPAIFRLRRPRNK